MGSSLRGGGGGRRIEVILKMQEKKSRRVRSWPELMNVTEELKIEVNIIEVMVKTQKKSEGVRRWGGMVRVDVNKELTSL